MTPPSGLSTLAIRRHVGTAILALTAIIIGTFAIARLQVDLLPAITYPRIGVQLNVPGIAPEVAIDAVTRPLEQTLSATEGVTQIFSRTQEGRVRVDLFFEPGGDLDRALNDATAAFNRGRNRLPDNVEDVRIFKFDPSQLPVYEFALTSPTLSPSELRVFADEELARELSVIPGVAAVDVTGGQREEVRVEVDPDRLQAAGLGLQTLLEALRERNRDVSGGRLEGSEGEPLTRTVGRLRSADELGKLALKVGDRPIFLRDVARVIDGTEEERLIVRLNGQPAVKVSVQKQPDANTIETIERLKQRLAELQQRNLIPADATLTATLDESRFIRQAIANVRDAGVLGAALAALAVWVFLGSLRQTLIIVLAIPLSSLAAVMLMGLFGLSLNLFSLGGLALGVGIVVDNAIVMLENISTGLGITPGRGDRPQLPPHEVWQQAERSSAEVESALVASTATNLVAVVPFLFVGGFISLIFNELVLTVTFAVAASLLMALTVVPMLASRLLAVPLASGCHRFVLMREFDRRFEVATRLYGRALGWVLQRRIVAIALAVAILGGSSLWMAGQIPQEILPPVNTGQANLVAQFPPGTTLADNRRVMDRVEAILRDLPGTNFVFSTVGGSTFGSNATINPLRSSSTITLKPGTDVQAYASKAREAFRQIDFVGLRLRINPERVRGLLTSNSPVPRTDIDIQLQGNDEDTLRQAGETILAALEERVPEANFRPDADDRQPELQILPDWSRLADLGLTAGDLGETLNAALEGVVPTELLRGNRLVDVRVRVGRDRVRSAAQIAQLPLLVNGGQPVRLGDVAAIRLGTAPAEIQRINQRQVYLLLGSLNEGQSLSAALANTEAVLAEVELPQGVTLLPSTTQASSRDLQRALGVLGGLASFLVFAVMAVQYNSPIDPLAIMLTVPLALAGALFGLFVTKTAIGATAIVGVVLLVGIAVNNAIVMVELANQRRDREGISRQAAILQAAPARLRPILMTTITTVLGLFPLALGMGEGSEFLQPLGIVVFSGLALATVLTLFLIPCFYVLLHELAPRSLREFQMPRLGWRRFSRKAK